MVKIRQLLGSARARRQAMAEMDASQYTGAQDILKSYAQSSQTLFSAMQDHDLAQDSRELQKLSEEMADRQD